MAARGERRCVSVSGAGEQGSTSLGVLRVTSLRVKWLKHSRLFRAASVFTKGLPLKRGERQGTLSHGGKMPPVTRATYLSTMRVTDVTGPQERPPIDLIVLGEEGISDSTAPVQPVLCVCVIAA